MSLGAALPSDTTWTIIDGNKPRLDPLSEVTSLVGREASGRDPVRLIAVSVMPGPQLVRAVQLSKLLKSRFPNIPIAWGGYFPSLYPQPTLAASYIDWVVRGQGEQTFRDLLEVLDGKVSPRAVPGLCFRDDGESWIGPERQWVGPDELPPPPYHKIDVDDYLPATLLGRRSAVYQASIGCPYSCSFCGVIGAYGSRQKVERPARTAAHLEYLVTNHGVDSLHFYDSNFFLREDHAQELCERMLPLGLSWWCEARVDAMLRFTDKTWSLLKKCGLKMVFLGAESGSDTTLAKMSKNLTTEKTLAIAEKTRSYGIIPEFSFVLGGPDDPEGEIDQTLAFVRRLKGVNPQMELITYFYTPTPQRGETYGNIDPLAGTPKSLDGWIAPEWVGWMTHEDPQLAWLPESLKARVEDFELVLKSRFPSVHDAHTRPWGKTLARLLAKRRWARERYRNPRLLKLVHRLARSEDHDGQAYGHLAAPAAP